MNIPTRYPAETLLIYKIPVTIMESFEPNISQSAQVARVAKKLKSHFPVWVQPTSCIFLSLVWPRSLNSPEAGSVLDRDSPDT